MFMETVYCIEGKLHMLLITTPSKTVDFSFVQVSCSAAPRDDGGVGQSGRRQLQ